MNLDKVKSLEHFNNVPNFYKEVITCWNINGWGQTKLPVTFTEIRKQVIWGNKFIKFENKSLFFQNWVKSGLIYVNDIINDNGSLSYDYIFEKLKFKSNWIAEFNILKRSIPKEWIETVESENSVRSTVNIKKDRLVWKNNYIETHNLQIKCFIIHQSL